MPIAEFVDPRTSPTPPWRGERRPLAPSPDELKPVILAIRKGRIYEVESWVRAGWPIQFETPKFRPWTRPTPLETAIRYGEHDAVWLLLSNGYDSALERRCPITLALRHARIDLLDLLLAWGADPWRLDPYVAVEVLHLDAHAPARRLQAEVESSSSREQGDR